MTILSEKPYRILSSLRRITAIVLAAALFLTFAATAHAQGQGVAVVTELDDEGNPVVKQTFEEPNIPYGSAIVMDAKTGAVLFERNAYLQRPMASTTKIMTTLLAIESGDIGRTITITEDMLAYDEEGSTKLGLSLGDNITVHDLILGMLLLSGNDCAQSIAVAVGGSFDNFASMMNERASEIGMFDTHFITSSGLDDPAHFSTAYDMALLGAEAMKNEDFASLCSIRSYTIQFGNPLTNYPLSTHNYLMEGLSHGVVGCDGIKTGYTSSAGFCLVSHAQRDGVSLICVTLGAPSYWSYHSDLYDYAFSKYTKLQAVPELSGLSLKVIGGAQQSVGVYCMPDSNFSIHENQVSSVYYEVEMNKFEFAPITADQVVGNVTYYYGTAELASFPIRAVDNVDCVTNDWLSAYIDAIKYDIETDNSQQ